MPEVSIIWFRRNLRVGDNAALEAACENAEEVLPLFVDDPRDGEARGGAARAWLEASLEALGDSLSLLGSRLVIRSGDSATHLLDLSREIGADTVHCERVWEPGALASESRVADALRASGVHFETHEGSLLCPPGEVRTRSGGSYRVFTPFHRAWLGQIPEVDTSPAYAPDRIPAPGSWPESEGRLRKEGSAPPEMTSTWTISEAGAMARLKRFVEESLEAYPSGHDLPHIRGTSELSPYLANGEISVRRILSEVGRSEASQESKTAFIRQLAWREFAKSVLNEFPALRDTPWRPEFAAMPWRDDAHEQEAWSAGRTGYPLVDAGMRQLSATGWMHNRVRMVAASLLAKHLLLPWQTGERVFWDALVDGDLAQNAFNWQWVAGSGTDASPYFRIFNPTLQARRFDVGGEYVRRWVPELAQLPDRWIHEPSSAPDDVLRAAGVVIGTTYPAAIIEHSHARERALAAYDVVKSSKRTE